MLVHIDTELRIAAIGLIMFHNSFISVAYAFSPRYFRCSAGCTGVWKHVLISCFDNWRWVIYIVSILLFIESILFHSVRNDTGRQQHCDAHNCKYLRRSTACRERMHKGLDWHTVLRNIAFIHPCWCVITKTNATSLDKNCNPCMPSIVYENVSLFRFLVSCQLFPCQETDIFHSIWGQSRGKQEETQQMECIWC